MATKKLKFDDAKAIEAVRLRHSEEPDEWCRKRLQVVLLAAEGKHPAEEVAGLCGISRGHVFTLMHRMRSGGVEALLERSRPGPTGPSVRKITDSVPVGGHPWSVETLRPPWELSPNTWYPSFLYHLDLSSPQILVQQVYWNGVVPPVHAVWIYVTRGEVRGKRGNHWAAWAPGIKDARVSQIAEIKAFKINPDSGFPDIKFHQMREEIMAVFLRQLPVAWEGKFKVKLQVVEFDEVLCLPIEPKEDQGWITLKGVSGHSRFICPISVKAKNVLCTAVSSRVDPVILATKGSDGPQSDFSDRDFRDLFGMLKGIPDSRRKHPGKFPLRSLLTLVCLAKLKGRTSPLRLKKWCDTLSEANLRAAGFKIPRGKDQLLILSYETMVRVVCHLKQHPDIAAMMDERLMGWLASENPPRFERELRWLNEKFRQLKDQSVGI